MNNRSINARIKEIRKAYCNDSNTEFAKAMGEKPNTVNNWVREGYSVGMSVVTKIVSKFPINAQWVLTGEGDMAIKEDPPPEIPNNQITIPLEVFEQITQMTETILSQQKTIYNQQEIISAKEKIIENLLNQLNQKKPIKVKKEVKRDFI